MKIINILRSRGEGEERDRGRETREREKRKLTLYTELRTSVRKRRLSCQLVEIQKAGKKGTWTFLVPLVTAVGKADSVLLVHSFLPAPHPTNPGPSGEMYLRHKSVLPLIWSNRSNSDTQCSPSRKERATL